MTKSERSSIAVVLPIYNVEPYLRDCVDSILAQTYSNFTVFAIDDGSTDESGNIIDEYARQDSRFVVVHQKNSGLSGARNTALMLIEQRREYEFIAFIDSDDKVCPDFLMSLIEYSNKYNSDITVCGYYKFSSNGKIITKSSPGLSGTFDRDDYIALIFSALKWKKSSAGGGMVWNKFFRSSVVKGVRFPVNREVIEDEPFCLEASKNAQTFAYIPDAIYGYRQRLDSLVRNQKFLLRQFECRKLNMKIAEQLTEQALYIATKSFALTAVALCKSYDSSNLFPYVDLKSLKTKVQDSASHGFIGNKTLIQYLLFCDYPMCSSLYLLKRRIMRKILFWRDDEKTKSLKEFDLI